MFRIFLHLAILVAFSSGVAADTLSDTVRPALVTIIARATSTGSVTQEVTAQSTGFFINKEGHVATAYHVIKQLGPIIEKTLTIQVFRNDINISAPAIVEFSQPDRDVLILKIPTAGNKTKPLSIAKDAFEEITPSITRLRTAGFSVGFPYKEDSGILNSFDGPNGPLQWLWLVTMNFAEGQSGSPVFLDSGEVVGVAKGTDASFPSHNFIIPIRYYPLTQFVAQNISQPRQVTVTAKAVTTEIKSLDNIRTFSDFSASCGKVSRSQHVEITSGKLDPNSIRYSVSVGNLVNGIAIVDVNTSGFTLIYFLEAQCTRLPFGASLPLQNAILDMSVSYKTLEEVAVNSDKIIATGRVSTGDQVFLPPNIDLGSVRVETTEPSGAIKTITAIDLNKAGGADGLTLQKLGTNVNAIRF